MTINDRDNAGINSIDPIDPVNPINPMNPVDPIEARISGGKGLSLLAKLNPPRISVTGFLVGVGVLLLLFILMIAGIVVTHPIAPTAGVKELLKTVTDLFALKNGLIAGILILSLGFSYLYIGRMKDHGLPPLVSAIPLLFFFGTTFTFYYQFGQLLQETNFLLFFAKAKRFMQTPTVEYFQTLFSDDWRTFIDAKKPLFNNVIYGYFVLIGSGILLAGAKENRYGAPPTMGIIRRLVLTLIAFVVLVIQIGIVYVLIQVLQLKTPSYYLSDYDKFMQMIQRILQWFEV